MRRKNRFPTMTAFLIGFLALMLAPFGTRTLVAESFVVGWGKNGMVPPAVQREAERVVALAGGDRHSVALLADGTVLEWDEAREFRPPIPADLESVEAIGCGDGHTVALEKGGRFRTWGTAGRTSRSSSGSPVFAAEFPDAVAIAALGIESAVLQADGRLWRWRAATDDFRLLATDVFDVVEIAMDAQLVWVLFEDGSVRGWDRVGGSSRDIPEFMGAIALKAGEGHLLALMSDGQVKVRDTRSFVRRGNVVLSLNVPEGLGPVRAIAAGARHNVVVLEDGSVVAWGYNDEGELNVPRGLSSVRVLGAGAHHSLAIVDVESPTIVGLEPRFPVRLGQSLTLSPVVLSEAVSIQWRLNGRILPGASEAQLTIPEVSLDSAGIYTIEAVDSQGRVVVAATEVLGRFLPEEHEISGRVLCLGNNSLCQQVNQLDLIGVVEIALGRVSALARLRDGRVYEWPARVRGDSRGAGFLDGVDDAVQVASGPDFHLLLSAQGDVTAWGSNRLGQTDVPPGLTDVVAIAAGETHALALRSNGTVVGWGSNKHQEIEIPETLRDVVAIRAGGQFSVALTADGSVVAWGDPTFGKTEVPDSVMNAVAIDAGLRHAVALLEDGRAITWGQRHAGGRWVSEEVRDIALIAAGDFHTTTVHDDGRIRHWGAGVNLPSAIPPGYEVQRAFGGLNMTALVLVPTEPEVFGLPDRVPLVGGHRLVLRSEPVGLGPFLFQWFHEGVPISGARAAAFEIPAVGPEDGGTYELLVADRDGDQTRVSVDVSVREPSTDESPNGGVWVWGGDRFGVLDVPRDLDGVTALAGGGDHVLALQVDGTVRAWGDNRFGQTDVPVGLRDVVAVEAGERHSVALTATGQVWAWGDRRSGQYEIPEEAVVGVAIAAGGLNTLILHDDGSITTWGVDSDRTDEFPVGIGPVAAVAVGERHFLALTEDGRVHAWGWNRYGRTDVPDELPPARAIVAGDEFSAALLRDGTVRAWGAEVIVRQTDDLELMGVVELAAGSEHLVARLADGSLVTWGGTAEDPLTIPAELSGVVRLAGGRGFSLALVEPGQPIVQESPEAQIVFEEHRVSLSVRAVGKAPLRYRWFNDGVLLPEQRSAFLELDDVSLAASGVYTVRIMDRDGGEANASARVQVRRRRVPLAREPRRLVVWGNESAVVSEAPDGLGRYDEVGSGGLLAAARSLEGQLVSWGLGAGAKTRLEIPERLEGIETFSVGREHLLVVKRDGTVDAYGENRFGQTTVPDGLFGVSQVAAGRNHSLALRLNGRVVGWGANNRLQAAPPEDLQDVVEIAAGDSFSAALLRDGTVETWGSPADRSFSRPIEATGIRAIAAGSFHLLGLREDGTVEGWGNNGLRQLDVPAGLDDVVRIAAGGTHSMALRRDGTVVVWGSNRVGEGDVPGALENVVAIGAGLGVSLAVVEVPGGVFPENQIRLDLDAVSIGAGRRQFRFTVSREDGLPLSAGQQHGLFIETTTKLGSDAVWEPARGQWEAGVVLVDADGSEPARFYRARVRR